MNVFEEYAGYYASNAVERVAAEALGDQYRGQTSSASWQEVRDYLGCLEPAQHWLDLGCGRGVFALPIAKEGCHVTGMDVAPGLVADAKRWATAANVAERCTFLCQDFSDLSVLLPSQFDGAICIGSLYWSQDVRRLFAQWRSVLKLGAKLIIFTNCATSTSVQTASSELLGTKFIEWQKLCTALHDEGFCLEFYEDDSENYRYWLNRWCHAMEAQKDALEESMGQIKSQKFFSRFYAYQNLAAQGNTRRIKLRMNAC